MIKPAKEPQDLVVLEIQKERMQETMQELTKEYLFLFNTIIRTQQELQRLEEALLQAQRTAEELYLERTDDPAA